MSPEQQESMAAHRSSSASEAEVNKSLHTSRDTDTEMTDGRGKNVLHRTRSNSTEDGDSPNPRPPKKKISPNHREKVALPTNSPGTSHSQQRTLPRNPIPRYPIVEANAAMTNNHPTAGGNSQAPGQTSAGPPLPAQPLPAPTPAGLPPQAQNLEGRAPTPPPGFISAAEIAAMKKFTSERTQTLAQRVAMTPSSNDNSAELTPCPEPAGFFTPQGEFSWWVIDNIHTDQIEEIGHQQGATVACIVEGENAHDGSRSSLIAAGLAREVKKLFPNEDPQVVPGIPATDPTRYTDPPYAYFIYGLTSAAYVQLVSRVAWRNKSIRFCAYSLRQQHISFLGYISGFSNLLSDGAMTKVLTFLTKAFKNGPVADTLQEFISGGKTIDDAGDKIIVYPEEIDNILDRLYVERIDIMKEGGIAQPSVNIYLHDVEYDDKQWDELRRAANRTSYAHPLFGIGKYYKSWTCGKCHGVTHPTGLCPFLSLEDDVPMTDPVIPPHTRARNQAQNKRESQPRGDTGTRRGRGKFRGYNGGR
jgi:hypothetical protein